MKIKILFTIGILIMQVSYGQECLNVKFKLRGYFYAGTSQIDSTALGGFYEDKNKPKKLTPEISEYSKSNELELIVKTDLKTEFKNGISGFKIFIINKSDSITELPAQDSRLYLKRQVFYKTNGEMLNTYPVVGAATVIIAFLLNQMNTGNFQHPA